MLTAYLYAKKRSFKEYQITTKHSVNISVNTFEMLELTN